jgi:hypothetical protein
MGLLCHLVCVRRRGWLGYKIPILYIPVSVVELGDALISGLGAADPTRAPISTVVLLARYYISTSISCNTFRADLVNSALALPPSRCGYTLELIDLLSGSVFEHPAWHIFVCTDRRQNLICVVIKSCTAVPIWHLAYCSVLQLHFKPYRSYWSETIVHTV